MTVVNLESVRAETEILVWCAARRAEIKELEDKAKAAVQDALGDADTGTLDDEIVVTWESHKRNAFDQKAFREAHPDLFEGFKTSSSVRRFEVVSK